MKNNTEIRLDPNSKTAVWAQKRNNGDVVVYNIRNEEIWLTKDEAMKLSELILNGK